MPLAHIINSVCGEKTPIKFEFVSKNSMELQYSLEVATTYSVRLGPIWRLGIKAWPKTVTRYSVRLDPRPVIKNEILTTFEIALGQSFSTNI